MPARPRARLATAALLATLTLLLAGCSSGDSDTAGTGPLHLTFWSALRGTQEVVDEYNRSQDRIRVDYQQVPSGPQGGWAKLSNAARAGNAAPAVLEVGTDRREREVTHPERRPRAVLAMAQRTARQVLDADLRARLAALTDIDPHLVLDDLTTSAAHRALADAELLVTGWGCPPLDAAVLQAAPRLRAVVHTAGTVRHHITPACWERGLLVSSAAAANAVPVAEYTLAMILLANKRVLETARVYRTERRRVDWNERHPDAGNYRRTVGILSASTIGRRVIDLLRPHDLTVLLHDPYVTADEARGLGARAVSLPDLFAQSDVVSVHTPLLPETRGLVSRELLARLRAGGTLINTARGAVIDQDALTDEVVSGRLYAVLDVTEPDLLPADSPLYDCPNVLLTPHIAGSKGGELRRLAELALAEIESYVLGRPFAHPVRPERLARLA